MSTTSINEPTVSTEVDLLPFLLDHAGSKDKPIAVWRLPESHQTCLAISRDYRKLDHDDMLEDLDPGFLFAPFDRSAHRLFIEAEQLFVFEDGKLKAPETPLEEAAVTWLRKQQIKIPSRRKFRYSGINLRIEGTERQRFLETVVAAVEEIRNGRFEKVVPSRARLIELPDNFDVASAFAKLCAHYPEALISFVSIPGVGHWLGASPEVLINVHDKRIFKTVALAGTQARKPDTNPRNVSWTQKEIEEQALVERYIISCFKKIRLREYEEYGPKTIVAGNLMHLRSDFTVDMRATNFPLIGSVMLDLLHPTSAVCGMPLDAALSFIDHHEGYPRGFYAGYLGPVNIHNNIELFVNLRCMQFSDNRGVCYAGAGVTIDSEPDKEWTETEIKLDTLLNVIL